MTRAMAEITRLVRQGALRAAARGFAAFGSEADQPPPNVDLARSGVDLHALFLPPTVTDYLARERCSLTLTTNDLELPWELLHDGREFLCLDRPVARMPMGQLLPDLSRRARPAPGPLRFLLVRPDPALGFAEAEIEALRARLQGRAEVDVLGPDEAGVDEVHDALTAGRHHVIHYAGHARFDADQPARSALLLRGGRPLYAEHVQRSLRGAPLVFLNACESAASAQDAADERASPLQVLTAGLASAFVYGGALGCVGAIWPVYDDGAAFLAGELYASLLEGTMVGEAMRQARVATRARFPLQLTWAAFVLYGDPTFQLVT